ncbi:hypothetical protein [Arthrobacter sp. 260]|uniref:hypothetical protein n=1 Tax=Arthrobacter sp. 260 TaxID=2735314 RepID=UPI00149225CC|nr:hypothetical protein [Arthrobacter sp. 260]NOJ61188.1 hypothetical protein [Arthrobacter sp. 260]
MQQLALILGLLLAAVVAENITVIHHNLLEPAKNVAPGGYGRSDSWPGGRCTASPYPEQPGRRGPLCSAVKYGTRCIPLRERAFSDGSCDARDILPSGDAVPVLGIGTWGMGEYPGNAARETAAIQMALDLGPAPLLGPAGVHARRASVSTSEDAQFQKAVPFEAQRLLKAPRGARR